MAVKIGRNDPCRCGSGKKYKKCCLATAVQSNLTIPKSEQLHGPVAGQLGLTSLYHFQDFDLSSTDDHLGRLTDILKNQRSGGRTRHGSTIRGLVKPHFDPALLDAPKARLRQRRNSIPTRRGGPELNHIDEKFRLDAVYLRAPVYRFSAELVDSSVRLGVCIASRSIPASRFIWPHYARNHNGICLEFAVQNTKFHIAKQVRYREEYPKLLLHDAEARLAMLTVKSDDWQYEKEFRLICPRFTDVTASPLIMDGNYLPIGTNYLTSIILGCQMERDSKAVIAELVGQHAPHVKVRQAKRAPHKYRLVIEDENSAIRPCGPSGTGNRAHPGPSGAAGERLAAQREFLPFLI